MCTSIAASCVAGLLTMLAGCTPVPAPTRSPSPSPSATARPAVAEAATAPCSQARPTTITFPGSDDLTLGALSFAGLALYTDPPGDQPNWEPYNAYFFKSGAQLPPGATATLSISDDAAGYASIATETGSPGGALTVTYTSCPTQPDATGSWWVGGFLLWGKASSCVPVTYTTSADPATTHQAIIPLGVPGCPISG